VPSVQHHVDIRISLIHSIQDSRSLRASGVSLRSTCTELPGKKLRNKMEVQPSSNIATLKSHKAFPRRTAAAGASNSKHSVKLERSLERVSDAYSYSSSERIRSWIPEPSPVPLAPERGLPLTPPSNSTENVVSSWIEDSPSKDRAFATTYTSGSSGIVTPVVQRSPPTPETTPPRVNHILYTSVAHSASRKLSSRAESFKTAREEPSSDDEARQQDLPSVHPVKQHLLKTAGHKRLRDIGLGLGMESEEDDPPLRDPAPRFPSETYDFVTFDGAWGGSRDGLDSIGADESQHLPRIGLVRRRKRPQISNRSSPTSPKVVEEAPNALTKSLSLRQRVERSRQSPPSASTERFAEQIQWPLRDEGLDIDAKLREVDNRRLSQMSATSTVVEAIVIDTPPRRERTLRHTGRICTLNTLDHSSSHSNRSSLISADHSHQHLLRHTRSPEGGPKRSFVSDSATSMASSMAKVRQDTVPVIVIPERRSSLKSSAPSSRRLSRTISLTSARQQSSRPTTAPDETVGYFDLSGRERRTISAVVPEFTPSKPEGRIARETPPALVAQKSSPSAPTSRNFSRTTSGTSASVIAHDGEEGQSSQSQPILQITEPNDIQTTGLDRSSTGDWSATRPRSALVTPFSLRSARSSTPGTLEVDEATAVSIYPHTNKSILVVQQLPRRNSQPAEHSTFVAGNANFVIPGPTKPAIIHQSPVTPEDPVFEERHLINSPLKNPRDPPQPPDFKIIPPTPANNTPVDDLDRHSVQPPSSGSPRTRGPLSMMKRALSSRRYSESFVSPLSRSLSRRRTISARAPSVSDTHENKLHPFWRPRGFWDDLSDSDSEFGNSGVLVGNSIGMPQPKTTTPSRTSSLSRRFGSLRLRGRQRFGWSQEGPRGSDQRRRQSYSDTYDNQSNDYEFIQPDRSEERPHDGVVIPRLGYQVQFVGFRGLQERMEKRKERREEGKRERIREKLRGSIGVVLPASEGQVDEWGR